MAGDWVLAVVVLLFVVARLLSYFMIYDRRREQRRRTDTGPWRAKYVGHDRRSRNDRRPVHDSATNVPRQSVDRHDRP